jgi:hypothetical protein
MIVFSGLVGAGVRHALNHGLHSISLKTAPEACLMGIIVPLMKQ